MVAVAFVAVSAHNLNDLIVANGTFDGGTIVGIVSSFGPRFSPRQVPPRAASGTVEHFSSCAIATTAILSLLFECHGMAADSTEREICLQHLRSLVARAQARKMPGNGFV